ncbi:hypothetical protein EV421DRAFT_2024955 [Armillaria borealis]|uniref:Uncharacterized protein n=1 Tax=Armillaria borealis TaxID=47425 RepID=A0AA39IVP1_9AGAR|nr:hypothetical protein EV421DRAFT_2024955 [Armillaria borealis]
MPQGQPSEDAIVYNTRCPVILDLCKRESGARGIPRVKPNGQGLVSRFLRPILPRRKLAVKTEEIYQNMNHDRIQPTFRYAGRRIRCTPMNGIHDSADPTRLTKNGDPWALRLFTEIIIGIPGLTFPDPMAADSMPWKDTLKPHASTTPFLRFRNNLSPSWKSPYSGSLSQAVYEARCEITSTDIAATIGLCMSPDYFPGEASVSKFLECHSIGSRLEDQEPALEIAAKMRPP